MISARNLCLSVSIRGEISNDFQLPFASFEKQAEVTARMENDIVIAQKRPAVPNPNDLQANTLAESQTARRRKNSNT
jgi:hypothetical protein